MPSNIFASIKPLLEEKNFNIDIDYDVIIEFLGHYSCNDWIYPDAMHRALLLDVRTVYEILDICMDQRMLEQYLQIYCPYCQRYTGRQYKTLGDIPQEMGCIHCDNIITKPREHAIIIYKVIEEST